MGPLFTCCIGKLELGIYILSYASFLWKIILECSRDNSLITCRNKWDLSEIPPLYGRNIADQCKTLYNKSINQSIRRERVVDDHVKGLHFLSLCSLSKIKVSLSCHDCEDLHFSIFNVLTPSSIIAFTTRKRYLDQFHGKIKDDILLQSSPRLVVFTKCQ